MSARNYAFIRTPRHKGAWRAEVRPKAKPPTAYDDQFRADSRSWKDQTKARKQWAR